MGDRQAPSEPDLARRVPSWWWEGRPTPKVSRWRPSRRTVRLAAATAAVLGAGALAFFLVFVKGHSHTIRGTLELGSIQLNSGCRLPPPDRGIAKGTEVTITDRNGVVLARSSLGPGKKLGPYCEFVFAAKVPDRTMYTIEIGHRGHVTYSKAYLDLYSWQTVFVLRGGALHWA